MALVIKIFYNLAIVNMYTSSLQIVVISNFNPVILLYHATKTEYIVKIVTFNQMSNITVRYGSVHGTEELHIKCVARSRIRVKSFKCLSYRVDSVGTTQRA